MYVHFSNYLWPKIIRSHVNIFIKEMHVSFETHQIKRELNEKPFQLVNGRKGGNHIQLIIKGDVCDRFRIWQVQYL